MSLLTIHGSRRRRSQFEPAHLALDGVSGTKVSTPLHDSLILPGTMDFRAALAMDNWSALASFVGRTSVTGSISYDFLTNVKRPITLWSTTGSDFPTLASTIDLPIANGELLLLRAVFVPDNGSNQRVATFSYKLPVSNPAAELNHNSGWVTHQVVSQATAQTVFGGTSAMEVGSAGNGTLRRLVGKVYAVQVRNGENGPIVANPNFSKQTPGVTSFTDSTGKVWTLEGGAAIVKS